MIEGVLFIGAVVAGVTQLAKFIRDKAWDRVGTVVIAVCVGILVALVDTEIGVVDLTVAQGIMIAFGAVGVVGTAEKIG
jgi:hypothetical protein